MQPGLWHGLGSVVDLKQRALLRESWAEGVETIITNHRYESRFGRFVSHNALMQSKFVGEPDEDDIFAITKYTPLFIDLEDNVNQGTFPITPAPPIDMVSGCTVPQMQQSLIGSTTLVQLEIALREDHDNPTEDNLPGLFKYVHDVLDFLQD